MTNPCKAFRDEIKVELIREWNGVTPRDPISHNLATDMHEILK